MYKLFFQLKATIAKESISNMSYITFVILHAFVGVTIVDKTDLH